MIFIYLNLLDTAEDKDRFEYIYIHFKKQMLHTAYELLNDKYDAEDVVHNTFVDIAKNIHIFENRSDKEIYSYLICATRGHAHNFLRKKNNEIKFTKIFSFTTNIGPIKIDDTIDFNALVEAIKNLHELYSDVLYLYYVQELTYKEIAALLGRKPATVRKQIERGKSLLLLELKKKGYSYE